MSIHIIALLHQKRYKYLHFRQFVRNRSRKLHRLHNERGKTMLTADELKTLREILDNDAELDDGSKAMIMGIAERNDVEG